MQEKTGSWCDIVMDDEHKKFEFLNHSDVNLLFHQSYNSINCTICYLKKIYGNRKLCYHLLHYSDKKHQSQKLSLEVCNKKSFLVQVGE